MRIVVNDNEVLIEDDEVYINGEAVPYDFWKALKNGVPNVYVRNDSEFFISGNKILIDGDSIFVNDYELGAQDVKKQFKMTRIFIEPKHLVEKEKKVLAEQISKGKGISKKILKNSDINLLRRVNKLDDKWFTSNAKFKFYTALMNIYAKNSKDTARYWRSTRLGLPIGALGITAGTCSAVLMLKSVTLPLILGTATGFAGATLALGTAIPRIIQEKKAYNENLKNLSEDVLAPMVEDIEALEKKEGEVPKNSASEALNQPQTNPPVQNANADKSGRNL